ncbi:ShKT domain and Cysteine-rich repeat-containing protein [Strongyloides ratti]|uniref:ShKT domain and Cysteine-rich repeat-containing protein n=1 Tax=Strongyloides ratti TaxID=34506 RepID=A0A090L7C0_STRRB|nr:ShKT domain and Cysteine-rich repeat-containing protein [Strongyloides ratti]CEF63409.1 ShKT domain and Cysteine-rich repeat-containing protein [Strongyloides ratti]
MSTSLMKYYLFFIYLLVLISSFIFGNDECPTGMRSLGKCINNLCPYESECISSQCCAYKNSNITTIFPTYTTTLPNVENEIDYCPDGSEAIGGCLGQYCPPGYVCLENVCCVDKNDSYEIEEDIVDGNVTQSSEIPISTETIDFNELTTKSLPIEITKLINHEKTTKSIVNFVPGNINETGGVESTDQKNKVVNIVDDKDNHSNHCPIGQSIGECISNECPSNYECIEGMCCKLSENINCKDILPDCKKHLCEKEEYFEFLTLKCGRTCKRCHQQKFVKIKKKVSVKSAERVKEKAKNTSLKKSKKRNLKCQDSRNDCEEWMREGFCYSPIYTIDQKKAICGVSCQLC